MFSLGVLHFEGRPPRTKVGSITFSEEEFSLRRFSLAVRLSHSSSSSSIAIVVVVVVVVVVYKGVYSGWALAVCILLSGDKVYSQVPAHTLRSSTRMSVGVYAPTPWSSTRMSVGVYAPAPWIGKSIPNSAK